MSAHSNDDIVADGRAVGIANSVADESLCDVGHGAEESNDDRGSYDEVEDEASSRVLKELRMPVSESFDGKTGKLTFAARIARNPCTSAPSSPTARVPKLSRSVRPARVLVSRICQVL
jgi:hypothetical protein